MSVNIIDLLSQQYGMTSLPKVDPNTQDITEKENGTNLLLQAIIPSIVAGFYQYSRNDENAEKIVNAGEKLAWPDILFGSDKAVFVGKIARYASISENEAAAKMMEIGETTLDLLKNNATPATGAGIKSLLTNQRTNILQHLPGAIGLGTALNDTTFDDRTNKMEGPVSSLMHAIEKQFASTAIADDKKPL